MGGGPFYVYEHVRKDTGAVFYVGKGYGDRAFQGRSGRRSSYWQNVVGKAGGFNVSFVQVEMNEELAFLVEVERIDQLRKLGVKLRNLTDGGDGTSGFKMPPDQVEAAAAKRRGVPIPADVRAKISASVRRAAYRHTPEQRKKMSAAHRGHRRALGYKHTEEWKRLNSERQRGNKSRLGTKQSEETINAISAAITGRAQPVITCIHCGKSGGNVMRRYHFDNCRSKP